jgi:hypothetical protein
MVMKNIYVLPTDKPSRLIIQNSNKLILGQEEYSVIENRKHIYITSDEEIKEGDWYFDGTDLVHKKTKYNDSLVDGNKQAKKIILTTDQDLIKDRIQAIDDEFLEWFVKNPSCEEVEVIKESEFYRSGPLDLLGYNIVSYKIIIPKKTARCCGKCNGVDDLCYTDMTCDNHSERGCEECYGKRIEYKIIIPKEEHKQETLEEAARNYSSKTTEAWEIGFKGFIEGAKWHEEISYSEQEVLDILKSFEIDFEHETVIRKNRIELWFNLYKK